MNFILLQARTFRCIIDISAFATFYWVQVLDVLSDYHTITKQFPNLQNNSYNTAG